MIPRRESADHGLFDRDQPSGAWRSDPRGRLEAREQNFKQERAGQLGSLLILSVIALLLPAFFDFTERHGSGHGNAVALDEKLSLCVSVILILVYLANLIYTLVTHRDVFASRKSNEPATWSLWKSVGVLIGATILIALESDLVANSPQATATQLGVTSLFLGVILLALIGNASDIISAVYSPARIGWDL